MTTKTLTHYPWRGLKVPVLKERKRMSLYIEPKKENNNDEKGVQ